MSGLRKNSAALTRLICGANIRRVAAKCGHSLRANAEMHVTGPRKCMIYVFLRQRLQREPFAVFCRMCNEIC